MPVDGPITGTETGLPDSWWITRVRRGLRDFGKVQADSVTGNGVDGVEAINGMPFQSSRNPILDGTVVVTDNGSTITVDTTLPPGAGHCYLDLDTGELIFASPPVNGHTISWKYRYAKWRDQDISDGLQAGLRAINSEVQKVDYDESLRPLPNIRDYNLPYSVADPDAKVLKVEFKEVDSPIFHYHEVSTWRKIGNTVIAIDGAEQMSPAGRFRLTLKRPYQALGDLEPAIRELPVWYALSVLLPHQEGFRLREDRMSARVGDQSPNPLTQMNTGDYYFKRFTTELEKLKRRRAAQGAGTRVVSTYEMGIRRIG